MNSNTQKIAAYAALALIAAAIVIAWGYFAFHGKADPGAFISQLSGLLTIVISAIAALGSVHIASASRTSASVTTYAGEARLGAFESQPVAPPSGTTSLGEVTVSMGGSPANILNAGIASPPTGPQP